MIASSSPTEAKSKWACEETVELPGRLRALARAPLRDQEVPPRRRDQGPGVLARRDVDSPSRIAVHERGRRGGRGRGARTLITKTKPRSP
jgi:hypothetical protein